MPRIYHPAALASGTLIELEPSAANHLAGVLRLGVGAALTLFNGQGGEYAATIQAIDRRRVRVAVGEHHARELESALEITLAQGIAKGERMDYAIQKATELGVTRIVPLITERTNVRLAPERWEKKRQHWRGVIIAACEQCGRNRLPTLAPPCGLSDWLTQDQSALRLALDPRSAQGLASIDALPASVSLLVGPEGGLSADELRHAQQNGWRGLRLGSRVLRSETAGLVGLALLQARWGDLG